MLLHNKRGSYPNDLFEWAEAQRIKTTLATRHADIINRYGVSPYYAAAIANNLQAGRYE